MSMTEDALDIGWLVCLVRTSR